MNQVQCVLNPWMGLLLCYAKLCHASVSGISSKSSVSCPKKLWRLSTKSTDVHSFNTTNMQKLQCYKGSHSCTRLMLCPWCARIYSSSHDPGYLAEPLSMIWSHHFIPTSMRWAACFIHFFDPKPLLLILFHQGAYILQEFWKPLEQFTGAVLESIELFDMTSNLSMSSVISSPAASFPWPWNIPIQVTVEQAPPPPPGKSTERWPTLPKASITPCTDHLYSSLLQHHESFPLTGRSETYIVIKAYTCPDILPDYTS